MPNITARLKVSVLTTEVAAEVFVQIVEITGLGHVSRLLGCGFLRLLGPFVEGDGESHFFAAADQLDGGGITGLVMAVAAVIVVIFGAKDYLRFILPHFWESLAYTAGILLFALVLAASIIGGSLAMGFYQYWYKKRMVIMW